MAGSTIWFTAPTRPGRRMCPIDDAQWKDLWLQPERCYIVITEAKAERLAKLVDPRIAHGCGPQRR